MQIFRQSDGKVMRFLGSLVKESPKETEHVFAVDDKERSGSGFRHLEEIRLQGLDCAFGYTCLPRGLYLGAHRDGNIFFEECLPDYFCFGGSLSG